AQTESLKLLQRVVYDAVGRDSVTKEWNGADSLVVVKLYDQEGNLIEVRQTGQPDPQLIGPVTRRFTYDEAERQTAEHRVRGTNSVEQILSWVYDPAGNGITGGRDAINVTLTYDVLNRLTNRSGANAASYTYEPLTGLLATADNAAARIKRTYYPNGQI